MSRSASNTQTTTDCPEFAVTREAFNRYFEKPMPTSTFHDFVNKGKIVPMKGIPPVGGQAVAAVFLR
jgi:hypothetical protein